jgi:dTMP kinase
MITPSSSTSTPKRGAFILLEGVDRCGKTTQVSLLVKNLISLSIATVAYRFPDRTTQGESCAMRRRLEGGGVIKINKLMNEMSIHLRFFFSGWIDQ